MLFKNSKIFVIDIENRAKILEWISNKLVELKYAKNKEKLLEAFQIREKEVNTNIKHGIATLHVMNSYVEKPTILFLKLKNKIEWNSIGNVSVNMMFVIVMPLNAESYNLKLMATLSKLVLDTHFLAELSDEESIVELNNILNKYFKKWQVNDTHIKKTSFKKAPLRIAAVTSCPTGIAHTHLAAESLEKYARENDIKIKVERQAAQGTENELTKMDIENADYIIISTGRPIDGKDRFYGKKVVQTSVGAPLKDCKKIFDSLQSATILKGTTSASDNDTKVTPMKAVLNGLSHMIPFVVVGGLFLAIALGVSGGKTPTSSFWLAILHIGESAFSLMVVILGGYIAFALGGRATLAPAMILTFISNGSIFTTGGPSENPFFYNYQNLEFGVDNSNLGFFGAIAIGLAVGYAVKYWNIYISVQLPKALRAVEPILITPMIFTFVGWVIFSFVGYLPLYYLSEGFKWGIESLISNQIFWIAGMILGAMVAFDMGGPVNKIAFALGVMYIKSDPIIMGAVAAAGAVAPIGSGLGYLFGRHALRVKSFRNEMDQQACVSGITMGIFGVSEGAIPYAIKHPISAIPSNMLGGATAGAIAAVFSITDVAAHTGPIVYIAGAVGKNGITDYGYGLLYIMAMTIGIIVTALSFSLLTKIIEDRKYDNPSKIKIPITSRNGATKKILPEKRSA